MTINISSVIALILFLLASFAAAVPGYFFRPGVWYKNLKKPSWRPPDWLFGPVWSILYILIAVSGWIVWQSRDREGAMIALMVFATQLILNGLWSVIFFGRQRPDIAMAEILLLWISIVATIILFFSISQSAAVILLPYAGWVSFAVALNFSIWRLNPGD